MPPTTVWKGTGVAIKGFRITETGQFRMGDLIHGRKIVLVQGTIEKP